MNRQEHLLTILSEECVEVAKEISKALRFSLDEVMDGQSNSNRERIEREIQDLYAMVMICREEGILEPEPPVLGMFVELKRKKVEKYLLRSAEYGALS